jgi:glycosyltransferase involved in cell wall biosynthesis
MKVSIVTAVRNGAGSIGTTLESVNAQDYPDVEHVVVDGASTDETMRVVAERGRRVGPTVSERDRGVYDAFNKGLALAGGEWIGFLGAGDRFAHDGAISRLIAATRGSPVDAVFADLAIVDPRDRRVIRNYRSASFTPARIGYGYMPAHPTLLLRRSVYERVGKYDISYRIAGDFELIVRAFAGGQTPYVHVPESLVEMEDGGLSNRGLRSKWLITREMRRACLAHGVPSGWLRLLMRLPVKYVSESFNAARRAPAR